jgi:hypothetical protein
MDQTWNFYFSLIQDTECTVDDTPINTALLIPNSGDHTLYCGSALSSVIGDTTSGSVRGNYYKTKPGIV